MSLREIFMEIQFKRRWYDKFNKIDQILDLMRDFTEDEIEYVMQDVLLTAMTVKKSRSESELISLGIEKIKGIMHSELKQRWYDKSPMLYTVMNSLAAMKEEDFGNIIEALYDSLHTLD